MKRKFSVLAAVFCLLAVCVLPVRAAGLRLVDDAGLLFDDESAAVAKTLDEISIRQGVDIVILTVDSTGASSPMEYADDYYDYHGYRADGILLLVSMEDRDWWVSTTGYGITAITDAGLDYISDRFVPHLSEGDYYTAFQTFAGLCDEFITQAKTGAPYDGGNLPRAPFRLGMNLGIALIIGLVIAFIVTAVMKGKLKSVRSQSGADDYVVPGSMNLTHSRDLHLYTHTDRRERPTSNGGSSTHISSSGRSHGGGGGKF